MIAEKTELLVDGSGWVDVGQCNTLACATLAGSDRYRFAPVSVCARNPRPLWRFTRYNLELPVVGEVPLITRARAEAGDSRVRPIRAEQLAQAVERRGRSAHSVLRVCEPVEPRELDLATLACWTFGLGQPFGVTSVACKKDRAKLFMQMIDATDGEIRSHRYADDKAVFYRPRLNWWRLSLYDRQTVYRLALLLHGGPGFYGARVENCTRDDFDALQWCAVASGAHARLDVQDTIWLTQDRGNAVLYKGLTSAGSLCTVFTVSGRGETLVTRWRNEIATQYLTG